MRPLSASFYDKIYLESEEYRKPYHESLYYPLWKEVIKHLSPKMFIAEVGCGTGQFADMLKDHGFKNYWGIDFSNVACKISIGKDHEISCFDFTDFMLSSYYTIVALEVLEHIEDVKFLRNQVSGTEIIATVPDFPAESHLRHFTNIEAVRERYGMFIDFSVLYKFDKWYIMKGTIK